MNDKHRRIKPGDSIQNIEEALISINEFDGSVDWEYVNELAHEIDSLINPERSWESPYADRDEEESVLESVAHSVNGSNMTTEEALDILDWAARVTLNGYSADDIKALFNTGAAIDKRIFK